MSELNPAPFQYRTIFISDFHMGLRGCNTKALLEFLRTHDSEYLYLVGDVFDGWELKKSWNWTQQNNDVVQKILRKVRKGTRVFYIPGNHDEFARNYVSLQFGGITVLRDAIHIAADGKRYLVLHGDEFDGVVQFNKWLAVLGSHAYDFSISLNHVLNKIRRWMGLPYWSLSCYLKSAVKDAVNFISGFEKAVAEEAVRRGVDGVICGHIHRAEMHSIGHILYCNDGDWVESCTALVEHADGRLEIVRRPM